MKAQISVILLMSMSYLNQPILSMQATDKDIQKPGDVTLVVKSLVEQKQALCGELIALHRESIKNEKKSARLIGLMAAVLTPLGFSTLRSVFNNPDPSAQIFVFGNAARMGIGYFGVYSGVMAIHCFRSALAAKSWHTSRIEQLESNDFRAIESSINALTDYEPWDMPPFSVDISNERIHQLQRDWHTIRRNEQL